jgi:DNA-binding transcriptional LysR family regulator
VVPNRLLRGYASPKAALLGCPHAAVAGDGQLIQRIKEKAAQLGGSYQPELRCDSLGQCLAAVKTGAYAAVLPAHVVEPDMADGCVVVDDDLEDLDRTISLIWNRRALDVIGNAAVQVRDELVAALRDEAAQRGMGNQNAPRSIC